MPESAKPWTLENVVEFERSVASDFKASAALKASISDASRQLNGAAARSAGFRVWLDAAKRQIPSGRGFSSTLSIIGGVLGVIAWLAGISGVLGMLNPIRGGIDVVLFLAILIGGQWLVFVLSLFGWVFRRRTAEGFSTVQALVGKLARKFAGRQEEGWWYRVMDSGGAPRSALLWHLARVVQQAGVRFNFGIICGLAGLVLVRNVGFFWETTTEGVMRELLAGAVRFLSLPWSSLWPAAVPDAAVIDSSRWLPGDSGALSPGPASWWLFLLTTTFVWGLLPRFAFWLFAVRASGQALAKLDFQARHHRVLWRELTGAERALTDEKPLDGVLVIDVGGSGLNEASLRPFLLQKLRVNPAAWHPIAVLGAESEAMTALALAPAGVVLLVEGWALSQPRMLALHSQIRSSAGPEIPVKFLVANESAEHQPVAASDEEREQWERFTDSLRDPLTEVYFYS